MRPPDDPRTLVEWAVSEAASSGTPAAHAALLELGAIGRVAYRDDVDTARLRRQGAEYRIEIGRKFLKEYVVTPHDVLHLLLHEALHRLRGDLHRPRPTEVPAGRARILANLAADMLVNAAIDRFLLRRAPKYFRRLYDPDRLPTNLLLPPGMLLGRAAGALAQKALAVAAEAKFSPPLARLYAAAWRGEITYAELLRGLAETLPEDLGAPRFLGDHDGPDDHEAWRWLDDTLGAGCDEGRRAGSGDAVDEERLESPPEPQEVRQMQEAVLAAVTNDAARPVRGPGPAPDRSVVPSSFGRRDLFFLAAGVWPTFFDRQLEGTGEDDRRVHVYIDVSGSTRRAWRYVYGLVLRLKSEIGEPVYLFSNRVVPVKHEDLATGAVRTTGGTDFDCVVEHALASRFRRILVVTDGEANLDGSLRRALLSSGTDVYAVLTEECPDSPIVSVARRTWTLPPPEWTP